MVNEIPVICGVHASDPRRRMWHWLGKVKDMGFSGINNFPTHTIIDGNFRTSLEETGMGVQKEIDCVALARKMDMFTITYVANPEEAKKMAEAGADVIIAHVGCTVGGSIGVDTAADSLTMRHKELRLLLMAQNPFAMMSSSSVMVAQLRLPQMLLTSMKRLTQ